jgi:hypothetical protein
LSTYQANAGSYWHATDIIAAESVTYEDLMEIDPRVSTTPATVPHLQTSGYVEILPEDDWALNQSSISYQEMSIGASSNELTPATSKLSPAVFVHAALRLNGASVIWPEDVRFGNTSKVSFSPLTDKISCRQHTSIYLA